MGMSIIRKMRRQKAIFWENQGLDGFGKPQLKKPVEIDCRWEDLNELIKTASGEERMASSVIYVDRDMNEGDFLMLGELTSLGPVKNPSELKNAHEIIKYAKTPVLRVRTDGLDPNKDEYLRTAWL